MKVYIETSTSDAATYVFDVEPTTTVQQLKQLLLKRLLLKKSEGKVKVDLTTARLVFDGEELYDDSMRLSQCGVQHDSMLELTDPSSCGRSGLGSLGAKFVDVSNESSLKVAQWSKTSGPKWWRAGRGLCLEGICRNGTCQANDKRVIMWLGYTEFDVVRDSGKSTTKCPMCFKYVDPITCSFNNCWWRWSGKKRVNDCAEPIECFGDWKYADDAYYYFDENQSGTVQWLKLILEAVRDEPYRKFHG